MRNNQRWPGPGASSPFLVFVSCASLFIAFSPALPQPAEALVFESQDKYNPGAALEYLTTPASAALAEPPPASAAWQPLTKPNIQLGYTSDHLWLRLRVLNRSVPRMLYLYLSANQLDYVDFYLSCPGAECGEAKPESRWIRRQAGDHLPLSRWPLRYSAPTLPFFMNGNVERTIFVHVRSSSILSFRTFVFSESGLAGHRTAQYFLHAFYIAVGATAMAIIAYLALSSGQRYFYYLLLPLGTYLLYNLTIQGDLYPLWPSWPGLQDRLIVILAYAFLTQILLYMAWFLQLRESSRAFLGAFTVALLMLAPGFASVFFLNTLILKWLLVCAITVSFLVLTAAVWMYFQGQRSARYVILLAVVIGGLGAVVRALTLGGILPYTDLTYNSSAYTFPFVFILLIRALYERHGEVLRERNHFEQEYRALLDSMRPAQRVSRIDNVDTTRVVDQIRVIATEDAAVYDPEYSLQHMAGQLQLRPDQLSEIFNKVMGTSFPRFLKSLRVRRAIELMERDPKMRILEVAFEAGFGSKAAFNAAFKEITGLAPSDFRRRG